jgi:poly(3-hydroxybutyrate) depolymerase
MRSSLLFSVLAAASTALAASAGCGKATTLSSGTKSITVNGKSRQYILQLPNNYKADTPYKLIIGFHWLNGNMNNVAPGFYGLRDLAKDTAIFLAPNGINSGWGNSGGEDVTFADQLIALAKSSACIDEDNIFATGFSYGGAMSYAMACARPGENAL